MRHRAIYNIYPDVISIDDEYGAFNIYGQSVAIDESLVEAEIARLQTEYAAKQYRRDRERMYPSIQDQLDLLYWDKVNGTNNWQTAIQAIKDKYPKL